MGMPRNKSMRFLLVLATAAGLAACSDNGGDAPPPRAETGAQTAAVGIFDHGREVVENTCVACHAPDESGALSRISAVRKSPEGWDMTIARMIVAHGLEISSEDRRAAVKYLADSHG